MAPLHKCGAKTRSGGTCKHPAGFKTDHLGEGRCWLHGGRSPIKHGRYSKITRPRIKELLEAFETDPDPLNLRSEVALLRALIVDFVERWDEYKELTFRWHALFTTAYREAVSEWREKMVTLLEEQGWREVTPDELPPVPDPLDFAPEKPRQVLDITAAAGMLDKVGSLVDRIEKSRREGAITLDTLNRVLEQLGVEVVHAAQEVIGDDATRSAILNAIERRWHDIRVDTLTAAAPARPETSR